MRRLVFLLFSLSLLLLSSCELRSHRLAWQPEPGSRFKLRYSAETRARAGGAWDGRPYVSSVTAVFSVKADGDPSKGQIDLALAVDTLEFKADERSREEDAYMDGRLRKYRARLSLSRTGQALSIEEEPALPPVGFSPLAIARLLAYGLPAFPDAAMRQGKRWEITQPLLDKFHPDSKVVKRFALSALRGTPTGTMATCLFEIEGWLDEDVGAPPGPALKGSGKTIFNLDKGLPESVSLEMEGRFQAGPGKASGDTASAPQERPILELKQKLELSFSDR